jgi:MoxR-like ATPase
MEPLSEIIRPQLNLAPLQEAVDTIRNEVSRLVVGQEEMLELIIAALLARGHVLIEGVPGTGKTMTARLIAKTINAGFSRIQFTPDLMPSDVTGTSVFNSKLSAFEFKKGPVFSNLVLIDEINRAPAKTQAALFEVMEEFQATVDGNTYPMADPFIILATQNPIEYEGTYRLPEAQLDRFLFKINVSYPGKEKETEMLTGIHERKEQPPYDLIKPVLTSEALTGFRELVKSVHIDAQLISYIAEIVVQTRANKSLQLGASPRAAVAILSASKAFAAMSGRDFVMPEDIQRAAHPVIAHRIILTPEREMEGITSEAVVKQIVQKIEVPR